MPDLSPREQRRDFNLFLGGQIRAYTRAVDGVEKKFIGGTLSSTKRDLYGSVLNANAQAGMMTQVKGLTSFLNHEYDIPEDVLGMFVASSLAQRTGDDGVEYVDLDIESLVDEVNPRAVAAWRQINETGINHGWSIGGLFLDWDWVDSDDDDYSFEVNEVKLLEGSLVGIPANERGRVHRAMADAEAEFKARAAAYGAKVPTDADVTQRRDLVKRALTEEKPAAMVRDRVTAALARVRAFSANFSGELAEPLTRAAADLEAVVDAPVLRATQAPDATREFTLKIGVDTTEAQEALAALSADVEAKRGEAEALVATIAERAAEATTAEAALTTLRADLAAAETALADARAAQTTLLAERDAATKLRDNAKTELAMLAAKIAEAKATRLGRKSVANADGSADEGSAPTAKPEDYETPAHERANRIGRRLRGEAVDARSQS